jgi:hypothetical protein
MVCILCSTCCRLYCSAGACAAWAQMHMHIPSHDAAGKTAPIKGRKTKGSKHSSATDAEKQAALDQAAAVAAAAAALPVLAPFVPRMLREKLAAAQLHGSDASADVRYLLGKTCCSPHQLTQLTTFICV